MHKGFVVLFLFVLVVACNGPVYESYEKIDPSGWHQDSTAKFQFEISDSIQAYNLFIDVRNQGSYEYSNLWLFLNILAPDSTLMRDTLNITLAKPDGAWLGKGTGGIYELQYPYRQNILFPFTGTYEIEIEQAMRDEPLSGVQNIGIKIDKN